MRQLPMRSRTPMRRPPMPTARSASARTAHSAWPAARQRRTVRTQGRSARRWCRSPLRCGCGCDRASRRSPRCLHGRSGKPAAAPAAQARQQAPDGHWLTASNQGRPTRKPQARRIDQGLLMTDHPRRGGRLQRCPRLLYTGLLLLTWQGLRAPLLLGVASVCRRRRVLAPCCPAHPRRPAAVRQVSRPT